MSGDYAIVLTDKTGEERSEAELEQMREEVREVVNRYGYQLQTYGNWESVRYMAVDMTNFLQERGYEST